jgi:pimeloyl-ACP methyl ester carboxylesterase
MRKVILIHGLWHGSWCWSLVTEQLAARDITSVAVDLDGHGLRGRHPAARWTRPFDPGSYATEPSTVADTTATSAAATLVKQIETIGGGESCVVVAHSMGGIVATVAAEQAPSLFAHLVYVSAFAPVSGLPAVAYLAEPENEGELVRRLFRADPADTGALRIDSGDAAGHAAIRETFYGDVDEATATAAIGLLSTDGPAGLAAQAFARYRERYGAIPHTYVTCTKDNTIPHRLQQRFVREIDAVSSEPTALVELETSHSPFLSQPATLAAVIADRC